MVDLDKQKAQGMSAFRAYGQGVHSIPEHILYHRQKKSSDACWHHLHCKRLSQLSVSHVPMLALLPHTDMRFGPIP